MLCGNSLNREVSAALPTPELMAPGFVMVVAAVVVPPTFRSTVMPCLAAWIVAALVTVAPPEPVAR